MPGSREELIASEEQITAGAPLLAFEKWLSTAVAGEAAFDRRPPSPQFPRLGTGRGQGGESQ
jgi:hypothetical protein